MSTQKKKTPKKLPRLIGKIVQYSYYNHRSSFAHEIYRLRTSLTKLGNLKETRYKSNIKIGDNKTCRKYKAWDRYWLLCMEETLAIASYNNLNNLLNQRFEIINACRYEKLVYQANTLRVRLFLCQLLNSLR